LLLVKFSEISDYDDGSPFVNLLSQVTAAARYFSCSVLPPRSTRLQRQHLAAAFGDYTDLYTLCKLGIS